MPFRLGFQIAYRFDQPTPMVAMLDVHDSHGLRMLSGPAVWTSPQVPLHRYRDRFGNTCTRLLAPAGLLVLRGDVLVREVGMSGLAADGLRCPLPQQHG